MVGDGDRRHIVGTGGLYEILQPDGPVEQTELGVDVQVNKRIHYAIPFLSVGEGGTLGPQI